ncbi:MAG: hopanoid biosynthesis-associated protein HpnK [Gammaproteobacteria bacterium]
MKGLIVTADDFGAAIEVNHAVEAAHRDGILTAASLMVAAPAAGDAVARAKLLPSLRVGLHVVLIEGRPQLPAAEIPHLVDRSGVFRTDMGRLGMLVCASERARRELASEITAQFAAFQATGLKLDHCNAHKHFHLHPIIGRLLISIGLRFGLQGVRIPLEPIGVLRKVESCTSRGQALLTDPFARILRRRARGRRLTSPDSVFGVRWSGQMTKQRISGLIRHLPDGLTEIYLHPATGPFAGSASGYRYQDEFAALLDPEVAALCRDSPVRLGGFGDFQTSAAAPPARMDSAP